MFADSGHASSEILEWLQEFRENLVDDEIPEHRDSHASSSHEVSLEPMRSVDLCGHSVYTHFSKRPKLRDLRAGDAMVETYFVLKILVS